MEQIQFDGRAQGGCALVRVESFKDDGRRRVIASNRGSLHGTSSGSINAN
jgi:hypothetical protein